MLARTVRLAAVLLVAGLALPAAGATKVAIAPLGPKGAAVFRQLQDALCQQLECVPWAKVSTNGLKDFAKAKAQGVSGLLVGGVIDRAGGKVLGINLYLRSPRPARSWTLPLGAQAQLEAGALAAWRGELATALGVAGPAAPPAAPRAPPEQARPPAPAAPPPTAAAPPRPVRPAPAPPPAAAPAPAPVAPPATAAAPSRSRLVAAEAGAFLTNRRLSFSGAGPGPLQAFDVGLFTNPRIRLEGYPLGGSGNRYLTGLGLLVDYAHSVGLETRTAGGKSSTTYARLQAGLLWRSPPLTSAALVLVPSLAYQQLTFSVSPAVAGLADAALSGVKVGLGVELPVDRRWTVLGGLGWVDWTTAQDLVKGSPAFFPGGSASALEAEAGLSVALTGPFSVRALVEYSRTSYTLEPDTTGTYSASGATDAYLGFRLMVRAEL
jgi:hypothetical protein